MTVPNKRIYELARVYKISSNAMVQFLQDLGFNPKSHMSVATPEMVDAVNNKFALEKQVARKEMAQKGKLRPKTKLVVEPPAKRKPKPKAGTAPATPVKATPPLQQAAVKTTPVTRPDSVARPKPGSPATPQQGSRSSVQAKPTATTDGRPATSASVQEVMRRLEKKRKKKERRKKKTGRTVDHAQVAKSFKATMANLSGVKTKKKYKKETGELVESDTQSNIIEINEFMSVSELAGLMDVKAVAVITKLFEMGMMATINQRLDMDTIQMVANEYGFETKVMEEIGSFVRQEENAENLTTIAPVVTVMGHVDHGKTSLLDYIRKTNVVSGEAGSITQHIGAYEVSHNENRIVFLDTPGHEAFTAMRARGAQITNLVVIVVAADEAVKPQTVEAIDHARAAEVPIIIAINKMDKSNADPDNVRTQLAQHNLMDEQWGGKTIMVEVSAKTGKGVNELLDMILLQAEMMDLKADPTIRAQGVIVDSRLEKGRGPVATVLIQTGTCHKGDPIVAGAFSGNVRTLSNDRDQLLKEAGPSTPVQVTGLRGVPQAGDSFLVVRDAQEAREITAKRSQIKRIYESRRPMGLVTLEKVFDRIREGQIKELRLIIKGDVDGSVEVLSDTLGKIQTDEVKTNIIRQGVGGVTESDVLLAAASEAIIIGFHVAPDLRARETARREKVDIRQYNIIYEAEDDIKKALEGMLSPVISEKFVGQAEVRETFRVPKLGLIAGCYVKQGRIQRNSKVRLLRDGTVIYEGNVGSLRRFKDDAKEVKEGFECGIGIENFNDIKVGDLIEAFELVETARKLE